MKTFFLGFSLIVSTISFGQKDLDRLAGAFKIFEADSQFKHAIISLYVVDSKTGKPVFDKNSQVGLAPASCLKVATSAASFELLGKDYRYKTEFGYDGKIENENLSGNIIVKASGDPTLGSWRWSVTTDTVIMQKVAAVLKTKRITNISGSFLIDDFNWETQGTPKGWIWEDIGNYYGAGARGLNWHENQYDLILKPGKKLNDSVEIVNTEPEFVMPVIENELKTGPVGSGDNSIIYLPENGVIAFLRGTIPAGKGTFKISGSIPVPAALCVLNFQNYFFKNQLLFNMLNGSSSMFEKKNRVKLPFNKLLTHLSPSLDSINYWFLQKSINLYGEAFVKTIAYEKTGFGATDTGINIIKDFWNKNGIEKSALHIIDGSGLSPANRVTTNALVTVMQYAKKQSWFSSFYNALPEQNGIKMKSGYIGGVRSYTGYIKSKSGAEYTFAFIINNYDGNPGAVREKMWKLLDILK